VVADTFFFSFFLADKGKEWKRAFEIFFYFFFSFWFQSHNFKAKESILATLEWDEE